MTCHDHRAALLDLARGVPIPTAVVRAAEAHADECPACAAELARQQRLTEDFRALAEASQDWSAPAALEARLVQAFVTRRQAGDDLVREPTPRWWIPAAAAIAATVVIGIWLARDAGPAATQPGASSSPFVEKAPAPGPAPAPPEIAQPAPVARVETPAPRSVSPRRAARPNPARGIEFVQIPAAVGLPALESASIVRMELPVSVLPAYGLAIVPEARRSQVEADVLVGQDGQPRGIRLVPEHESEPRSRQ